MTPHEDPLTRALRSLPRSRAASGFTGRVLTRLDEPRRPPAHGLVLRLALAGALVAALVSVPLALRQGETETPPRQARLEAPQSGGGAAPRGRRLEALRAEYQQLSRELADLKRLAADPAAPVLYLGGDEEVDVYLDLGELARRRPGGGFRPAALGPGAPQSAGPRRR